MESRVILRSQSNPALPFHHLPIFEFTMNKVPKREQRPFSSTANESAARAMPPAARQLHFGLGRMQVVKKGHQR